MDAKRFNLRLDIDRAQQLLLQAREQAMGCESLDIEIRLKPVFENFKKTAGGHNPPAVF